MSAVAYYVDMVNKSYTINKRLFVVTVPRWAEWIAKDCSQNVYVYRYKPYLEKEDGMWCSPKFVSCKPKGIAKVVDADVMAIVRGDLYHFEKLPTGKSLRKLYE